MQAQSKAILIIAAMIIFITGLVFLILYGVGRGESLQTTIQLPSDNAAKSYVIDHKLLASVTDIKVVNAGGPNFKTVTGLDDSGSDKMVWLTGKDDKIVVRGSTLVKEGVDKQVVIDKLKEKNIAASQIEAMFVSPYDYTSGRIVWFIRVKDIRKHWLSYDYKTAEFLWEVFQDPTAWKL